MHFGITGGTHIEVEIAPEIADQVGGMGELAIGAGPGRRILRWIAAQREHVLDAIAGKPLDNLRDLSARVSETRQVRHRRYAEIALNAGDALQRARPGGSPGAVG